MFAFSIFPQDSAVISSPLLSGRDRIGRTLFGTVL